MYWSDGCCGFIAMNECIACYCAFCERLQVACGRFVQLQDYITTMQNGARRRHPARTTHEFPTIGALVTALYE